MHKNRLLELTQVFSTFVQISGRSDRIGSKLREPLVLEKLTGEFDPLANEIRKMIITN